MHLVASKVTKQMIQGLRRQVKLMEEKNMMVCDDCVDDDDVDDDDVDDDGDDGDDVDGEHW